MLMAFIPHKREHGCTPVVILLKMPRGTVQCVGLGGVSVAVCAWVGSVDLHSHPGRVLLPLHCSEISSGVYCSPDE